MARLPDRILQKLEKISVDAPLPYLRKGAPAKNFNLLRQEVIKQAGFDFLAKADLLRPRNYVSSNPNVAKRSRHICGDSFDFDVNDSHVFPVREQQGGLVFWRVYLLASEPPKGRGVFMEIDSDFGKARAPFVDFTALAERHGFHRVPAWAGWSHSGPNASLRGFWHFECTEGLTWDEATNFLYAKEAQKRPIRLALNDRVLGLNDRLPEVKSLQTQLVKLKYLTRDFCNEVFDSDVERCVREFQTNTGLPVTGIVDPATRYRLTEKILTICSPGQVWPEK